MVGCSRFVLLLIGRRAGRQRGAAEMGARGRDGKAPAFPPFVIPDLIRDP